MTALERFAGSAPFSPKGACHVGAKVRTANCAKCLIRRGILRAQLPPPLVNELCDRMWLVRGRKRQVLFTEGSPATQLFAIRTGAVKLVRIGADGRSHITALLEPGALFGCEALFEPTYRTDAEVLVDSELCVADAPALESMLRDAPTLALDLAHFLHTQLTVARQRLAMVGTSGAQARVAGYVLLRLDDAPDATTVRQDLTLDELGGVLGLSGETVCRMLAGLRERGAIEMDRQMITVRDLPLLRRLARL